MPTMKLSSDDKTEDMNQQDEQCEVHDDEHEDCDPFCDFDTEHHNPG